MNSDQDDNACDFYSRWVGRVWAPFSLVFGSFEEDI